MLTFCICGVHLQAKAQAADEKVASLEQSLAQFASSMGDKERSRENVGHREEGLKHKARQLDMRVREAEHRYTAQTSSSHWIFVTSQDVIDVNNLLTHLPRTCDVIVNLHLYLF